ncbi:MAG: DUF4388 domain-containing protein [Desulfobulbaceae bacterium]|nr:DUF4388 domain-containing protein [Desulfobulbaceae bacterium]
MTNFPTAFKVVNERNCPFYGVDDWFVLTNQTLKVPDGMPSCLILVREFTNILFSITPGTALENPAGKNGVYTCGGCTGIIKFRIDAIPEEMEEPAVNSQKNNESESMEGFSGKQQKKGVVVSGSLEEISPSELLQFFHMHQKTGKLFLDLIEGTARVAFREGAIIGARYGEKEDKDAIFSVLGESRGNFSFVSGIPEALMEVDGIGDFMMILLEGLKRLDESRAENK